MKSNKLAVSLALAALIISAGSFIFNGSDTAQAQVKMNPYVPVMSVEFAEDPHRMHSFQIESFWAFLGSSDSKEIFTVPADKKFIVTDLVNTHDAVVLLWANGETIAACTTLGGHSFGSGVVCQPGQTITVKNQGITVTNATVTGYWVDL